LLLFTHCYCYCYHYYYCFYNRLLHVHNAHQPWCFGGETLRFSMWWLRSIPEIKRHNNIGFFKTIMGERMLLQGSKLKKSLGCLLATSWRNIVARSKFLVPSLYKQNNVQAPLVEKSWKCLISSGIAWDTFIQ